MGSRFRTTWIASVFATGVVETAIARGFAFLDNMVRLCLCHGGGGDRWLQLGGLRSQTTLFASVFAIGAAETGGHSSWVAFSDNLARLCTGWRRHAAIGCGNMILFISPAAVPWAETLAKTRNVGKSALPTPPSKPRERPAQPS